MATLIAIIFAAAFIAAGVYVYRRNKTPLSPLNGTGGGSGKSDDDSRPQNQA